MIEPYELEGPQQSDDYDEASERDPGQDGPGRGRGHRGRGTDGRSRGRGEGRSTRERDRGRQSRVRARRGRGDVRLAVLSLLAEQPMHGYQIISEIDQRSDGAWRPSPGSVYPLLQQLTDEGLVRPDEEGDRRVFSLTDDGRDVAGGLADTSVWESRSASRDRVDLKAAVGSLGHAASQVARVGTPEQAKRAEEILVEARKQIYRLLAED